MRSDSSKIIVLYCISEKMKRGGARMNESHLMFIHPSSRASVVIVQCPIFADGLPVLAVGFVLITTDFVSV